MGKKDRFSQIMEKKERLSQIADLSKILKRLVKEYNDNVCGEYEAHIAEIKIFTNRGIDDLETEIHLHGNTDKLGIEFSLEEETKYDTHIVRDYATRFHGVYLTDCQFEWTLEKEDGENASMAV